MNRHLRTYAELVDAPSGFLNTTFNAAVPPEQRRTKVNGNWTSKLPDIAASWMSQQDPDFDPDTQDVAAKIAETLNQHKQYPASWTPHFIDGIANMPFCPPYQPPTPGSPSYSPLSHMEDSICEDKEPTHTKAPQPREKPEISNKEKIQTKLNFHPVNRNTDLDIPEPKRLKQNHEPSVNKSKFCVKSSHSPQFVSKQMNTQPPSRHASERENQNNFPEQGSSSGRQTSRNGFDNDRQNSYDNRNNFCKQNTYDSRNNYERQSSSYENKSKFNPRQNSYKEEEDNYPADKKCTGAFTTARTELVKQNMKKYGHPGHIPDRPAGEPLKKSLGGRTRIINSAMKKPEPEPMESSGNEELDRLVSTNEEYKNFVSMIESEVMDVKNKVTWDDIAGLKHVKDAIQEIVVMPLLCPEIFNGLRAPPKGLLLFGPPGTGKTMIGKCIASEADATFFSVSASTVTSKWFGTGEKMVKTLFAVARAKQPSVVFIDEIDSLLTSRSENEHESNRRMKTEFLVQMDGVGGCEDDRVLVVGATNRPQELDDAARRRLQKRLYVPLPDHEARRYLVHSLISSHANTMDDVTYDQVAELTDGYSCADLTYLCKEASMGPIRGIPGRDLVRMKAHEIPPVSFAHFQDALKVVKPSVASETLSSYDEWNARFGFGG